MNRDALATFLVTRREALRPEDVGLPTGVRRRVKGLRREEIAQLATMSTDYYTRLEQRRGPQPSTQMLDSLARALRLTLDERDYLYRMAGHPAPDRDPLTDHVAPPLLHVLDHLSDSPAFILNALGEVLVQNDLARVLLGDARGRTGMERSDVFRWFVHPEQERRRYPAADRARQSLARVADLRAAYGAMGPRSRAGQMARELSRRSPEFARLWDSQVVARRFEDHKVLIHPEVGPIELDCQALLTADESQVLLVLTAAPHSEAESQLELLRVLSTQEFAPDQR